MVMSWQYIAGFFDGEGSMGINVGGRRLGVYIAQSGPLGLLLLGRIRSFLDEQGVKSSVYETGKAGKHRRTMPSYRIGMCGFDSALRFITCVFPYLYIKKSYAQDVIRYNILYPSLNTSPLASAWRREKQQMCMLRGAEWHAVFDGKATGRPKGPRIERSARAVHQEL
jgi:hypothetical protein